MSKRTPPPRDTSKLALLSVRAVALGSSALCGLAIGLGTYADAMAEGALNLVLTIGAALVVAVGVGTGWHFVLGIASHSGKDETHKKALAVCLGAALCITGVATSAWFLAAKIGGASALRAYRLEYVRKLSESANVAALNAGAEQGLIASFDAGTSALRASAMREAAGTGASGKAGRAAVYESLMILDESMNNTTAALREAAARRDEFLTRADRDIAEAAKAATAGNDETAFEQAAARAARKIADADNIHLKDIAANVGGGVVVAAKARPIVDDVISRMNQALARASDDRRPVALPVYEPKTAKDAVISNPPPLAWIAASVIEFLPMMGLLILMLLWRTHDDDDSNSGAAPALVPAPAPRPRPAMVPEAAE